MLEHTRQRAHSIASPQILSEILSSVRRFVNGEITREEWLALDGATRSTLAGAIAGNFAMHHPSEAFEALQAFKMKV